LIVEKYLTDSLRADRKIEADRIANANLMPSYLTRQQFVADSIRAFQWFKMTKDSSYIDKYILNDDWNEFPFPQKKQKPLPSPAKKEYRTTETAMIDDKNLKKKKQEGSIS